MLRQPERAPNKGKSEEQISALPDGLTLLHTLQGHTAWITSVAWSPDGQILASAADDTIQLWNPTTGQALHSLQGPTALITSIAWSPNSQILASGAADDTIRLWNPTTGKALHILQEHTEIIMDMAWSPDGRILASCAQDHTVRLWNPTIGQLLHILRGHTGWVRSVAWSPDGQILASASDDNTVRLWNSTNGQVLHILRGHTGSVVSMAWSPDSQILASASEDNTVRLWNPTNGEVLHTLQGHTNRVASVAWSPDSQRLASGGYDSTVRLWDSRTGHPLHTLQVEKQEIDSAIWSPDKHFLLANADNGNHHNYAAGFSLWRTDTMESLGTISDLRGFFPSVWHPQLPLIATVGPQQHSIAIWQFDQERLFGSISSALTIQYTNAKVVLLGDSGVGKSGLGLALSGQPFVPTESTHGRRVWTFQQQEVALDGRRKETRETLLWDLAGQPGYRLIHQLSLQEVAVALVVFDAQSEIDPFAGVRYWHKALQQAQKTQGSAASPLKKVLVQARRDRGGVVVSPERIQALVGELGFDGYFETSAKEGWQIDELQAAIRKAIAWETLPRVSSSLLFYQIKEFLVWEKQQARRLLSTSEDLYQAFLSSKDASPETPDLPTQFEIGIGRVEAAGLIRRLSFGNLILLQPELLDTYASALINVIKDEPDGLGSIAEEQVRVGDFFIPTDERIKNREQEKLLLLAMIEDLLRRELALREEGMLVFPSQSTKERPDLPDPQGKAVFFRFEGSTLHIYTTLAVRLARSGVFKQPMLWKDAVTYTAISGGTCGLYLRNLGEGSGELTLFFDEFVSNEMRTIFEEFVYTHLKRRALPDNFTVRYVLACDECRFVMPDEAIRLRSARGFDWLPCPVCETRLSLTRHKFKHTLTSSLTASKMDRTADAKRDQEAAQLVLQGKIETEDFDVFLCHNSGDKSAIKQLGNQLKEQGILPWLDEWELRPGLPWQRLLEQQIGQIKAAAVFVGKNGIGPWQQQELEAFLRAFVQRGYPVIPVLLSDAKREPKLPLFLQAMTWVDFRRPDPDPMQRLIWGITGKRDPRDRM